MPRPPPGPRTGTAACGGGGGGEAGGRPQPQSGCSSVRRGRAGEVRACPPPRRRPRHLAVPVLRLVRDRVPSGVVRRLHVVDAVVRQPDTVAPSARIVQISLVGSSTIVPGRARRRCARRRGPARVLVQAELVRTSPRAETPRRRGRSIRSRSCRPRCSRRRSGRPLGTTRAPGCSHVVRCVRNA